MFTSCKKYDECPVCYEDIHTRQRVFLHDDHCICLECMYKLSDGLCPICKEKIDPIVRINLYISGINHTDLKKRLESYPYEYISRVGSQWKIKNMKINPYNIKTFLMEIDKTNTNIKSYYRIK